MLENFLWGLWNGITAWPLLLLHIFGIWEYYPVFNVLRDSWWYQFGFLIGAGSPFFGFLSSRKK